MTRGARRQSAARETRVPPQLFPAFDFPPAVEVWVWRLARYRARPAVTTRYSRHFGGLFPHPGQTVVISQSHSGISAKNRRRMGRKLEHDESWSPRPCRPR